MYPPYLWRTLWSVSFHMVVSFACSSSVHSRLTRGAFSLGTMKGLPICQFRFWRPPGHLWLCNSHHVERLRVQSKLHASNCSLQNTVPRHHAYPSQYHSLDFQAYLKTAKSSDNTSHRVNAIPGLQWLEAWIQVSHSMQFAIPNYIPSCTSVTHQKSENSLNDVRVGHCLMVLLWMLRYHMKQGA